jgi:HlyD family secretion protein
MTPALSVVLLFAAAAAAACGHDAVAADRSLRHRLAAGTLDIVVRERGELQAARDTRVTSQVEGKATLIYLIREGTVVKQGDLVAKLDTSAIEEKRATQAIAVAKAEAALDQTRKSCEIAEKELLANERMAQNRLRIAELRLEKFVGQARRGGGDRDDGTNSEMLRQLKDLRASETGGPRAGAGDAGVEQKLIELVGGEANLALEMGEMANHVLQQIDEINLARADLKLAEETLGHSRRLAAKSFVTRNELERDEINYKRQLSRMTVACNNLQVLVLYTLAETRIGLLQEIENAQLGLESVRALSEARRVREKAELKSCESEFALAKERLDNCDRQIQNGVMTAPAAGLVVYGRLDWDEPVYEGMEIRERQEVVLLPDVASMLVEIKVNEAQIDKVAVGQSASVRVDTFPDRCLGGRIVRVSTLPDPTKNPEVKVYRVGVLIDADNRDGLLRPGMNGTVEIDVGRLDGVFAVPLAAVKRRGDSYWVFRADPGGPVATRVKLGSNNLTHVQVLDGLQAGDEVWLVQPEGAQLPVAERSAEKDAEKSNRADKAGGDKGEAEGDAAAKADEPSAEAAAKKSDKKKKDKAAKTDAAAPAGGQR